MEAAPTIYDYTDEQAEMLRLYELRTAAMVGGEYHTSRASYFKSALYAIDAISTVTASGAFVTLAFWKTAIGSDSLEVLVFLVAVLAIARSSFRISDLADQHGRLAYSWREIFMELDQIAFMARRAGHVTEKIRADIDSSVVRFQRIELMDEMQASSKKLSSIQAKVEDQLPADRQWIPPS